MAAFLSSWQVASSCSQRWRTALAFAAASIVPADPIFQLLALLAADGKKGFAVEAWIQPDATTLASTDYCPLVTFGSNESNAGSTDYNFVIEQLGTDLRISTKYSGDTIHKSASSMLDDSAYSTQVCVA